MVCAFARLYGGSRYELTLVVQPWVKGNPADTQV